MNGGSETQAGSAVERPFQAWFAGVVVCYFVPLIGITLVNSMVVNSSVRDSGLLLAVLGIIGLLAGVPILAVITGLFVWLMSAIGRRFVLLRHPLVWMLFGTLVGFLGLWGFGFWNSVFAIVFLATGAACGLTTWRVYYPD